MIVVTYACCLLHILVAFHTKAPTLAWFDAIHIAVFSVSGFCAHYFDSRLRIKTFLTGLQRDTLTRRLRLAHRDLKRRAEHDGLTGLLTRNALVRRLKPVLAGERAFFLGIMDIDDFRGINDTFGHSAGDVVLRRMGAVLQEQLGDADMASRIGDEFVFVMPGIVGKESAESLLPRICVASVTHEDVPCPISVSIGFAAFPNDGAAFEVLHKEAARRCIMPNGRGNGSALFTGNCLSLAPRLERNDRLIYSYAGGGFRLTGGILFYIRKVRESRAAVAPPTPPGSKESNGNGCSPGVRLSKSASPRVCAFRLCGYRRKGGRHESGMCRRVCVGSGH